MSRTRPNDATSEETLRAREKHGTLRLFEVALVLVRIDHVASFIVNANHGIV
jgi:hypothetical protein